MTKASILILAVVAVLCGQAQAQSQNKVVVIPMGGADKACPTGQKQCADVCVSEDDFPGRPDFHYVDDFVDYRLRPDTQGFAESQWFPVTDRVINFTKCSDTSLLRVTYQDTLGTRASIYGMCEWRIVLNDLQYARFSAGDHQSGTVRWTMDNGSHTAIIPNFPAGEVELEVQVRLNTTESGAECLSGWNSIGEYLSVEEF